MLSEVFDTQLASCTAAVAFASQIAYLIALATYASIFVERIKGRLVDKAKCQQ